MSPYVEEITRKHKPIFKKVTITEVNDAVVLNTSIFGASVNVAVLYWAALFTRMCANP